LAWSPDSQHLLLLASFSSAVPEFWVAPLDGAATRIDVSLLGQQGLLGGPKPGAYPIAWLPGDRIVFSAQSGDSRNYWAAQLSRTTWRIEQPLQRLTSGAGIEGYGSAVAALGDTRLAFSSDVQNVDLWSVPLDRTGLHASSPPFQLTQDAALDREPTLTPDGTTLIWASNRQRRPDLWARNLVTGRETPLLSMPPSWLGKPVISPDGSKLAFFRMESGYRPPSATLVAELSANSDGTLRAGQPVQLPKSVETGSGYPWSWSADGQRLWYAPRRSTAVAPNRLYDVAARKTLAEFGHPQHNLYELSPSPDGRWLAFSEPLSDETSRLVVAPIVGGIEPAGPSEWIAIALGDPSANKLAWSPAGDVFYYESSRDGHVCVWAQRLARDTMRPVGPPVAIHHAHNARLSIGRIGSVERGLAAARDKVIFNMAAMSSSIWMAEFTDGRRSPR
jgi:Tol biopolymer transport system component